MHRSTVLTVIVTLLSACANTPAPQGQMPPLNSINTMVLRLHGNTLESLGKQQAASIAGQIAANLTSWGYAVSAAETAANRPTHALQGSVSAAELKGLPPGFSINFGSDDQRAPERQKAHVVTVTCELLPLAAKTGKVSLSGEFGAPDSNSGVFSGLPNQGREHFYVDRIGSVCLNLLAELKATQTTPSAGVIAPTWIPDMRIEVKTKEGKAKPGISAPSKPVSMAPENPAAPAVASEPPKPTEAAPVSIEQPANPADQRKQLIIHNQGSPIILEFGYDENRGMKP